MKHKKKITFKTVLGQLSSLKQLQTDTKLPYYFDLMWDLKHGYQILKSSHYLKHSGVRAALAEHGYDVKSLPDSPIEYEVSV